MFHPHARPVSGIAFHATKQDCLFSCSYDGSVRAFNLEKAVRGNLLALICACHRAWKRFLLLARGSDSYSRMQI